MASPSLFVEALACIEPLKLGTCGRALSAQNIDVRPRGKVHAVANIEVAPRRVGVVALAVSERGFRGYVIGLQANFQPTDWRVKACHAVVSNLSLIGR